VLLSVLDATFEFVPEAAFARHGSVVAPLLAAPYATGGGLWIPLHFVTDVAPRLASGLIFDRERRELRVFSQVARRATAPAPTPPAAVEERDATPPDARADPPSRGGAPRRWTVVVDAGHGGPDAGMSGPIGAGPRVREKDVTLAVSQRLREALAARGVTVVMTRTKDTLIALADRGRIANQRRGDLFVSVHVNSANPGWRDPGAARGFETYFLAEAKTEDARRVAERENEVVRFETASSSGPSDPLGFILSDMKQNEYLRESSELAQAVQRRMARVHPGPSRGVKQAGFRVLLTASMPAILVEIGFGSNRSEAAYMTDATRQRELAGAIADAAVEYLEQYARRATGATP
jgi:N-acetylmuramoyl-L-alanine amidase